ncbi:PKD domain-containing protein [[Eubacterium] cellulosolvens]
MERIHKNILAVVIIFTFIASFWLGTFSNVSAQTDSSIDITFGTTPIIDGMLSPGEWDDAEAVQILIQNGISTIVYYKHDSNNLYFGFDTITDYYAEIYFDTSHDGGLRPRTDDLLLHASAALYEQQGTGYGWGDSNYEITGWNASTMYKGDGQIEYSISFLKIGITAETSSSIGIAFSVSDSPTYRYLYYWPSDANQNNPNTWGEMSSSDNWGILENQPPTASALANPMSGPSPLTVSFTGTGTDNDGEIIAYYWDFDDGTVSNEQNPTHTFQNVETYNVQLTVTDDGDATGTAIVIISVTELPTDDGEPEPPGDDDNGTTEEQKKKKDDNGFLPGFELFFFLIGIFVVILFSRKRGRVEHL